MYSNPMDRLYPTGMLLLPHLGLRGAIRPLQANHPLVHKEARQVLVSSVVDCLSVLETLFSSTGYGNGQERKGLEWGVRVSVARPSQTYDGHCCCYKGKGHRRGGGREERRGRGRVVPQDPFSIRPPDKHERTRRKYSFHRSTFFFFSIITFTFHPNS